MPTIRIYEGPHLDENVIADLQVAVVPRVGEAVRTTLGIPSSTKVVYRDRYVVRAIEHAFHGSGAAGATSWSEPTIWVLVEEAATSDP